MVHLFDSGTNLRLTADPNGEIQLSIQDVKSEDVWVIPLAKEAASAVGKKLVEISSEIVLPTDEEIKHMKQEGGSNGQH